MQRSLPIKILFAALFLSFLLPQLVLNTGCANQIPPTGGTRDSIPPVLISAKPADSSINFTGKKIILEFNEFVTVENASQNLLVSPTPKIPPGVESKLRAVTVTIKDTLEPNTTYTYDFGNAIKDINESNILKNFSYTFSTGNKLDDLEFTGKVLIAQSGLADSTLIAVLHRKGDDSAVIKEYPRYISRLDKAGNFHFKNLPAGTFYLYAFQDPGSKRYSDSLFAYADSPIIVSDSTKPVILYAYTEIDTRKSSKPPGGARTPPARGGNAAADKRLRLETTLQAGEQDLLKPFEVYFRTAPLKEFDSTKIIFADEKLKPITNYRIIRDTSNTKLTIDYPWVENTGYTIIVDKDFASDTAGRKLLKSDTLEFRTRKQSEYGSIRLRFPNLDLSKNPVLQIVQNGEVITSHVFRSRDYYVKLYTPGEYDLRILYDDNKNGIWDRGKFFGTRKQPERVVPVTRKLIVKANWDAEVDITL